jgi:hypothetical protein
MIKWCWFINFEDPTKVIVKNIYISATDVGLKDGLADPEIHTIKAIEIQDFFTREMYYFGDDSIKLFDSELECIDYAINHVHERVDLKEEEIIEKRLLLLKKIFLEYVEL